MDLREMNCGLDSPACETRLLALIVNARAPYVVCNFFPLLTLHALLQNGPALFSQLLSMNDSNRACSGKNSLPFPFSATGSLSPYPVFCLFYSPKKVPTAPPIALLMAPFANASKQALSAHAHAAVPMRYSSTMFQPITKAMNSPTVT